MKTSEIREAFLNFFESQGHTRVASASLIPENDPTLMFVVAGMVPFKDCFLGLEKRPYTRATSAQKCVRAGGKHNDLENVGFTARHHTFFEMMGNFSFGDYSKKEAIHFAWEFSTKVLGLPKEKLRVSVFEKDDEAAEIWHKQEGVPLDRIVRFGEADNFWSAGATGPCGPCSEIFYDQGKEVDGDRWLEFWNLVFMQYDRDASGSLTPLPKPSVDTGLGLERVAAILQNVESNYDIDLMAALVTATRELTEKRTGQKLILTGDNDWQQSALRVIADHLRSVSFLLADGVLPSNEGRGYVLRRILRRAVRFGKRLGMETPFLTDLYPALVAQMGAAYPDLKTREKVVREIMKQEEEKFFETMGRGLELLEGAFAKVGSSKAVPADIVFQLYDTFGFPVDLTALIARERGLTVNEEAVAKLMERQQAMSRASWKGSGASAILPEVKDWKNDRIFPTFVGYSDLAADSVLKAVTLLPGEKEMAWVAIDPSPFYGEGGGQVGDVGTLETLSGEKLEVLDSQKPYENGIALLVRGPVGALKKGEKMKATVETDRRSATRSNHTATHLLHAALREVLGKHVTQAGSLVEPGRLRFDFSHGKGLTKEEVTAVETWVNNAIERDISLSTHNTNYKEAIEQGAMALFGEKYGDVVRFVKIPGFSAELCGGTHVASTGDIHLFKILSEGAVASGVRRIEAVTRKGAMEYLLGRERVVENLSRKLKSSPEQLEDRVEKLLETQKSLEREIDKLRRQIAQGGSSGETSVKTTFNGHPLVIHALGDGDAKLLRDKGDAVRKQDPSSLHLVLCKNLVLLTLDPKTFSHLNAGDVLQKIVQPLGGRAGGQAQTAQGQIPELPGGLESLKDKIAALG